MPDTCLYARVDVVDSSRGPLLMELELIEPELYFLIVPEAADRMAQASSAVRRGFHALLAFLAVALSGASSDERAMGMLQPVDHCRRSHAAGERDEALAKIAAWTADDSNMMRAYVEASSEAPVDTAATRRRRS